jgi:protein O-mannosyl-transferase
MALLVALPLGIYANTLGNALHLDDFYRVRGNPGVEQLTPVMRHFTDPHTMSTLPRITQYRPLLPLTLSLNYALAGGHSLVGYHLTNLALLVLCALLGYALCRRLLEAAELEPGLLPLGVALVFAIHPVAGVPVNYVCSRDLLLMQLFLLAALLCYLAARRAAAARSRVGWALLALLSLALSLLSKQNALVAPALIVVLELTVLRQRVLSPWPWLRALPAAALGGGFFLLTERVLGFSDVVRVAATKYTTWHYALTQTRLHLTHYLRNMAWPWSMHPDPGVAPAAGVEVGVALGAAVILATLVLAALAWRRRPLLTLCILYYWLLLAPSSSVLPFHHLAADYRPFPGTLFLWLALGLGLRALAAPRVRAALTLALVLYFSTASVWLNRTWRTEESLWRHAVAHGGGPLAHHNLAMSLTDMSARVALLRRVLVIQPNYVLAHLNLGRALVHLGRVEQGLAHVRRAATYRPDWAQVQLWAGYTFRDLGRRGEAARAFALAARLDPRPEHLYEAALALQLKGDVRASLPLLLRLDVEHRETGFLLGWALQHGGQLERAVKVYERFLKRHPRHVQARFNLAHALMTRGDCQAAAPQFREVLRLKPGLSAAQQHLNRCARAR